jgi:DNA repair exonuclease SbcCD nuclease subunit
MKRRRFKERKAILTADWHLRDSQPTCRIDDFWSTQWKKAQFILSYNLPVYIAGDLFHKAKSSPNLERITIDFFNFYSNDVVVIAGNHDLPYGNFDELGNSSLGVIKAACKNVCVFQTVIRFGVKMIHRLVCQDKESAKLMGGTWLKELKLELKDTSLILCGDNHQTFTGMIEDIPFINPGSLTRQTADQVNHRPCFFLMYSDYSTEKIMLPFEDNVISREHIDIAEEKNERLEAFVKRLSDRTDVGLSFQDNVKVLLPKVGKSTAKIVKEIVYGE